MRAVWLVAFAAVLDPKTGAHGCLVGVSGTLGWSGCLLLKVSWIGLMLLRKSGIWKDLGTKRRCCFERAQ